MAGYLTWDEFVRMVWGKAPLEKEIREAPANILAGTVVGLRRRDFPPDVRKVRVTIDGQTIEVPEGTLVIEAAKIVGIDIPHFCYHPRLEPVGVCRQCLVEIGTPQRNPDGTVATDEQGNPIIRWFPKPQPSCVFPVSDGMVVKVKSEGAEAARRAVMEFLLINHPLDCPVCDRGGECPLQNAAFVQGRPYSRFTEPKRFFDKPVAISDYIALDRERCIMCKRCIRFCEEIAGEKQLEQVDRGWWSYIAVAEGESLDTIFSGNVIDICPVGALTSLTYRFVARPWELERTETVCPKCPVHCSIYADCRFNHPLRFVPAGENLRVNDIWMCDIGRFEMRFPRPEDRLGMPLMRVNGELRQVSWEQALEALAEALEKGRQGDTKSLLFLGTAVMTNEEAYLFQRFARSVIGSGSVDFLERDGAISALVWQGEPIGLGVDIYNLQRADCIVVLGCNIYRHLPIAWLWVLQAVMKGKAKLVVAGVREDKRRMRRWAWEWLTPKDIDGLAKALAEGVAKVKGVSMKSLQIPSFEAIGVPEETVRRVAEVLGQAKRPVVICGCNHDPQAVSPEGVVLLRRLLVKKDWDAVCYAFHHANERGCMEAGLVPDYLPGLRPITDEGMGLVLKGLWGNGTIPSRGYDVQTLLEAVRGEKVTLAWVVDPAPVHEVPTPLREILGQVPHLVVSASVLTPLAQKAWLVLPDLTFVEKNGSYTNWAGTVQPVRRAVEPPSGARSLAKVLMALSERLGKAMVYPNPQFVRREMEQLFALSGLGRKMDSP